MSRAVAVRRLSIASSAVLAVALQALPASANQIFPTACDGFSLTDRFEPADSVCVAGDVDYTCPSGPISLPAADVYVYPTGTDPLLVTPVHFETLGGFGSFVDQVVFSPPLPCGTYDIWMDERCDGVLGSEDVREVASFVVAGASCPDLDAGTRDGGALDAGVLDGGSPDAGSPDAGSPDGGSPDAGSPDGGSPDGGVLDAGGFDAGALDGGSPDGGSSDAGGASDGGLTPGVDAGAGAMDGGCGCRAVGGVRADARWLLIPMIVLFCRRRGSSRS